MTLMEACNQIGIEYKEVPADGKRYDTPAMGKDSKNTAGRIKLFPDGKGGIVSNWINAESLTFWYDDNATAKLTAEQQQERVARIAAAKQQEEAERAECRKRSAELWEQGRDVKADHPYLKAKNIKPYGIKQLKESLLVPVRDSAGTLHGIQFIQADGSKKFKSGTAVTGCYHAIGKPNGKLLIGEGFATCAALHEITGFAVACAFSAGNLKPVAEALRAKLPDTTLIICADDDYTTDGNPGILAATNAARAVNALLAVPSFPDTRGAKDSDYNDMAKLTTPEAVRACIDSAALPTPSPIVEILLQAPENPFDAVIARLAALHPMKYDQVRKAEAKALGVQLKTLDAAVRGAQQAESESESPFDDVTAWHEPVDGAELLTMIAATIRRFIVCGQDTAHAVALWIAMTWFIDVVQVAPLAVITAPEKRCGKSLLLSLIARLVPKPLQLSSISPSALYRSIDAWQPTLLIDEVDACLKDNEELRGLINCGHTRDSAFTVRCVGEDHTPTKFKVWGAKALSGIGHVADTLMDRAVILELRRKLPGEKVERIRHAEPGLFNTLQSKLARFAEDYSSEVQQARPPLPESLNDRAQDNWEPLLAVAMVAGGDWLNVGTKTALKLSGDNSSIQTVGTELLFDIQEVFDGKETDRITTSELIKALCADDEKRWSKYNKGFPISPRQLSTRLNGYDIHSKDIRIGCNVSKGFERYQFEDAFIRYAATPPEIIRDTLQIATSAGLAVAASDFGGYAETVKATHRTATSAGCSVVADKIPLQENILFSVADSGLTQLADFDF